jgi:hypothetical protein
VEKHPDKTFIGLIAKGFDFLGYSFEPKLLSISSNTLSKYFVRKTQLYEQGAYHRCIWEICQELVEIDDEVFLFHHQLCRDSFTNASTMCQPDKH